MNILATTSTPVPIWTIPVVVFSSIGIMIIGHWILSMIRLKSAIRLRIFPRFTIKQISLVSIMIAISIAFVSILVGTTPIAAFPQVRTSIEALLIKIIGLFFGPAIGFVSGLLTDGLTSLFFPFSYHWGYTLMVATYGLFAGVIKVLKDKTENKPHLFLWSNLLILISLIIASLIVTITHKHEMVDFYLTGKKHLTLDKWVVFSIFTSIMIVPLCAILLGRIIWRIKDWKIENYNTLTSIIILATTTELFINTMMTPAFDSQIFGVDYTPIMMSKFLFMPVKIVVNSAIIYITYTIIYPLIRKTRKEEKEQHELQEAETLQITKKLFKKQNKK